jgi:F-type H+-transporting ATPase subunit epsilon
MIRVSVISPERTLYEGEAEGVVAPAFDGEVGILTGHAPMMTLLGRGVLRLTGAGQATRFQVEGGFLQVVDNQVRVVTERATAL